MNFVIFVPRVFDEFWDSFYQDHVTNFMIYFLRQFDELSYFFCENIWRILGLPFLPQDHLMIFEIFFFLRRIAAIQDVFLQPIDDIHFFFDTNWHVLKMYSAMVLNLSVYLYIQNIYVKRKIFYFMRSLFNLSFFLHCNLF